jgi:flagellar biosynthesis protein FlhB
MGFIGSGFMVLFGFLFGALSRAFGNSEFSGAFSSIFIMVLYIGLGILYFFPSLYLFKFSASLKSALEAYVETQMTEALKSLRSFFSFVGIMIIVMLLFCVLAFAGVIVFGILGTMAAGD